MNRSCKKHQEITPESRLFWNNRFTWLIPGLRKLLFEIYLTNHSLALKSSYWPCQNKGENNQNLCAESLLQQWLGMLIQTAGWTMLFHFGKYIVLECLQSYFLFLSKRGPISVIIVSFEEGNELMQKRRIQSISALCLFSRRKLQGWLFCWRFLFVCLFCRKWCMPWDRLGTPVALSVLPVRNRLGIACSTWRTESLTVRKVWQSGQSCTGIVCFMCMETTAGEQNNSSYTSSMDFVSTLHTYKCSALQLTGENGRGLLFASMSTVPSLTSLLYVLSYFAFLSLHVFPCSTSLLGRFCSPEMKI